MLIEAFAIFFNGAYFQGPMTLAVIGSWIIVVLAVWAAADAFPELLDSRLAAVSAVLLASFWLWTGTSIFWSISADLTWNEFNRTGGYLAIFFVGLVVARYPFARTLAAGLFLAAAGAAVFYSLGPKLFPATIDNPDDFARISIPIGYANAQGLLAALTFVPTIFFAARKDAHWAIRILAAVGAPIALIALFFTISRGATIAIVVGLITYFILSPLRIRSFAVLLLAAGAALPVLIWSNAQDALMHDNSPLALRLAAAAPLQLYLLLVIAATIVIFAAALAAGRRFSWPSRARAILGTAILIVALMAIVVPASLFLSSKPSVSGWASQTWKDFTMGSRTDPGAARLLEVNSSIRWNLWKEAVSNWKQHIVAGSGAQSFHLTHMMTRQAGMPFVKQAHSMPFSLLSELGLVGFVLMGAFVWLTLGLGIRNLARTSDRWQRGLAAALMAFLVTYLIHASYDWDWNMFALTLPYFFFAGILAGWRPAAAIEEARPAAAEGTRAADAGAAETPRSVRPSAPAGRRDKGKHYRRRRATAR